MRYFQPVSPDMPNAFGVPSNDQVGFLNSTAKERWAFGGNRSGKTEIVVADCVLFCTGQHPVWSQQFRPPVYTRFCAPSYEDSIKLIIMKKFRQMVKREDLHGGSFDRAWSEKEKTLRWANGSYTNFKSFEQRVNKFGGDDLHAVYSDEHGGKTYYRENKARLADYGGFFVSSMTPEEGALSWEKKHVKRRAAEIGAWKFTTFGNPHLSAEGVKEMLASIDDPRVVRVKMYGDFSSLAGLVYPQYEENIHVIPERPIPPEWYRVVAIDPHMKKETAIVWAVWTPEKELIVYRSMKVLATVDELKSLLRVKSSGERIRLWIGDEAMGGDGLNIFGQRSVLQQLASGQDRIPVIPTNQSSDKSFEAGVNRVREMLTPDAVSSKPNLYIMRTYQGCDNMGVADEFDEYQFIPDSPADELTFRERVRKIDDDYMDDIRYIVMAEPVAQQDEAKAMRVSPGGARRHSVTGIMG